MTYSIRNWFVATSLILQPLAFLLILTFALASTAWSLAAVAGWAPWLQLQIGLGSATEVAAGVAIQSALTLLLIGLCFFLPTNVRVMTLERSHRQFKVSMQDVARAYQAVHAADRDGSFEVQSEFDSVRDRLSYLRQHADLGSLEPEVLEMAAQMSHESRELAGIYSNDKVERARIFLKQRQEEARTFQERIDLARATCRELKRWLENVQVEEAVAHSQMQRLQADLEEMLPALGLGLIEAKPQTASFQVAAE